MKKLFTFLLLALFAVSAAAQDYNCFSIIAGKNATADGSVLLAHNEDDSPEQMLNIYVTQREEGVAKYIWAEFPGMKVADSFLNEHGVAIASDSCPSKEDKGELTDGGVLYEVRVSAAKYARTAREAVKIIGELIDKYGYEGSGRSYLLADSKEGWILSVVQGKHWVAQRIPDDKVMVIPNYYVIDKVDLSDTENFAGSPDIISYAESRGWYNPSKDGEFSFRKAYARPNTLVSERNTIRHLSAIQYFTGKEYPLDLDAFEFAVTPKSKVTLQDMINVLRSHGENTPYYEKIKGKNGDQHPGCICVNTTVSAAVFQLRSDLPAPIASVMWLAPYHPCTEVFTPWYIGMTETPQGYGRYASYKEAQEKHFSDAKDLQKNYPDGFYWGAIDRFEKVNADFHNNIGKVAKENDKRQKKLFKDQKKFEKKVVKAFKKGLPVEKMLNAYTADAVAKKN